MTTASSLSLLTSAINAANGTWPKPIASAIEERDRLAEAVATMPSGTEQSLMAAATAALLDGRDPLADPEVTRLVVARALTGESGNGLALGVARAADARIVDAIIEHVDKVLAIIKAGVDAAGATLTRSYDILGDSDLSDSAAMLKLGPAAATAWAEARDATKTIRQADRGWFALAELAAIGTSNTPTLRLTDVSLEQFEKVGRKADPWAIVGAGAAIDMADRVTIRERERRIAAEREQRDQRNASAYSESYQRIHGIGKVLVR